MSSSDSANNFPAAQPSPSDNLPNARPSSATERFLAQTRTELSSVIDQAKVDAHRKRALGNLKQQLETANAESKRLREEVRAAKDRKAQLEEELRVARLQYSKDLEVMRTTFETVNNNLRNEIQNGIESLRMELVKGSGTARTDNAIVSGPLDRSVNKNLLHREFDRLRNKASSIGSLAVESVRNFVARIESVSVTKNRLANLNNDSRVGLVAGHQTAVPNQAEAAKRSREEEAESSSNSKRPRLESVEGLQAEPFADDEAGVFDLADNGGDNDNDNNVSTSPCGE